MYVLLYLQSVMLCHAILCDNLKPYNIISISQRPSLCRGRLINNNNKKKKYTVALLSLMFCTRLARAILHVTADSIPALDRRYPPA